MEMECLTEFPHTHMDRRARKRQRLGWDVQQPPKAQSGMFCGQEVGGDVSSFASSGTFSDHTCSSMYAKGTARNGSPPWRDDDKDGHYMFALGENLTSRYKIHSKMGEGTFGQVLECWDRERKEMVAIKIVRSIKKYREAAMIEIDVLEQLIKHDKGGSRFKVFEKLGPSLYDFLRKNNYRSFPIDLVRELGSQLLEFMHDMRLIHTDLKPENILLVSADYIKIPIIRFHQDLLAMHPFIKDYPSQVQSSTTYEHQDHSYIVSTRHYRAPEGEALFQTHENLEHLAMMEKVLGPIPQHMLKRADRHAEKYVRKGRLDWPEGATSRESIRAVLKLPRLQNLVMQHVDHSAGDLIDLLQGLLRYDP
ncbi:Serine/threonine-protein kinase AFC2 [Acorus calamus]|uniref:Serine/threonine-protein kinase AFC2 n=1 Tax=Acorus calamus TaxID=4465 RepID=A0AAV9D465_ACOCL|nr:Serine/threonine-protein kinase AFC2 [Acorus calamus]